MATTWRRSSLPVERASEPEHGTKSWEERKRHTIDFLASAPEEIVLVALADKLDNISSTRRGLERLGEKVWDRFHRGKEPQRWYFESLAKVFAARAESGSSGLRGLAGEFREVVEGVFGKS